MTRIVSRVLFATVTAGLLLGGAGLAQAAEKAQVRCEVTTNGKKEIKHVATAADCTKMGGTVVHAKKK